LKTEEQIQKQWNACLKERSDNGEIIDWFNLHPPLNVDEENRLRLAKSAWEHLSAWMQALEYVMTDKD
jgi:hypothetical protein